MPQVVVVVAVAVEVVADVVVVVAVVVVVVAVVVVADAVVVAVVDVVVSFDRTAHTLVETHLQPALLHLTCLTASGFPNYKNLTS